MKISDCTRAEFFLHMGEFMLQNGLKKLSLMDLNEALEDFEFSMDSGEPFEFISLEQAGLENPLELDGVTGAQKLYYDDEGQQ